MPVRGVAAKMVAAVASVLVAAACGQGSEPRLIDSGAAGPTDVELARLLPTLADYPSPTWDVRLTVGAMDGAFGPYVDPRSTVEPADCWDIPFQRRDSTAASAEGSIPNAIAGDSGEAAVRIMRERPGSDLIAESVGWARHCPEYRLLYPGSDPNDPADGHPTAVSVMAPIQVAGVEVARIHLTDNRAHRDQAEGSRESVVSLARVRGLVVVAFRHDNHRDAAEVLAVTIQRLSAKQPAPRPTSEDVEETPLNRRTDKELQRFLPGAADLPAGWAVTQGSPVIRDDEVQHTSGCDRTPFENSAGWRTDLDRDFRQVASASANRPAAAVDPSAEQRVEDDEVRLAIEDPGVSVIDETAAWASKCATYPDSGHASTVQMLPATQLDGLDVINVRVRRDDTASLIRLRGLLIVTKPALSLQHGPLAARTIDLLRHARFDTPATGPDSPPRAPDPRAEPPDDVVPPAPSEAGTTKLAGVARGALVAPEPYRFGGYLPGDPKTRSPDYLHFRSPSGVIACTWRRFELFCDVPGGTYPRAPKPVGLPVSWNDGVVAFGPTGFRSGVASDDPIVYAESNVLPYGSTIRLDDDTECLMATDGLTCVAYRGRIGLHLSRDDLTPLSGTAALVGDSRALPR